MWDELFRTRLSPLACHAGQKRLAELKERLSKRETQNPLTALIQEWLLLSTEMADLRLLNRNIFQLLEAGSSSRNEVTAVSECLRLLYTGRQLTRMLRAQNQYLDTSAVSDECHRRRHRISQLLEYCTRCLLVPELHTESQTILEKIGKIAQELAEQDDQLWPLREVLILLCGHLAVSDAPSASMLRQWLLQKAYSVEAEPWLALASLEAWANFQPAHVIEPVLTSLLCTNPQQREKYGQNWPFMHSRFAQVAGQHRCWSVLRAALPKNSDSEFVQIEIVRQLTVSSEEADHDFLCHFIADANANTRARAAAAILGREVPDRFFQKRFRAGIQPNMPEWLVETVLLGLAEQFREQFPPVSLCLSILKYCSDDLSYWQDNAQRRDLINAAAAIQKGARIGRTANLRKAFSELNERWLQNTQNTIRINKGPLAELSPKELATHLSFYAYNGDDYCIHCNGFQDWDHPPKRGYVLQKGWRRSVHLWRMVYEFLNPRPDKRQGYSHLSDRSPVGHIAVVSDRLSEVTPTMVPGQRYAAPDAVDWRPELPLPSMLLHAATLSKPILIQTPSTQYLLSANGMLPRLQSNMSYHELNLLRQRLLQADLEDVEKQYDTQLKKKGFSVERLPLSMPLISLQNIAQNVLTVDSNSILHLFTFSIGLLFWWITNAITERIRLNRWRKSIPLVIGGWGSRGKSGTERLKAAMIQGMGYSLFAKTTGCEAMMVAGIPGAPPEELFLYRPYDKASITEQRMVLKHAAQFDAQVLLWECMALNPRYVNILQNDWMRDDFTTLTNTYPDHEDIQGPTGLDVAHTISQFIPFKGHVVTTEQHMIPILRQTAWKRASILREQSVLDWRLLGRDVLDLLPYNEHPKNIALVLGLADELGIPKDQALWSFGQFVIPDIGVLKSYGPIQIEGRSVSFTNGMSANERAGFLSNWSRSPFSNPPDPLNPVFQVVMFNNRADRLPRQSIFASIAAMDTQANLMLVIGSNVGAFYDEWLQCLHTELIPSLSEIPIEKVPQTIAKKLRVVPHPHSSDSLAVLEQRLRGYGMMTTDYPHAERLADIASWTYQLQLTSDWSLRDVFETLIVLLKQQFIPVHDYHISGDALIHLIVSHAPPEAHVRILGAENIKGTGLDFVYRWLSIDLSLKRLAQLESREGPQVQLALRELSTHMGYGQYDLNLVLHSLHELNQKGYFGTLGLDTEAAGTLSRLRSISSNVTQKNTQNVPLWKKIRDGLKYHLDIIDSFRRVHESDLLYKALVTQQVGLRRAALESKAIIDRQK